MNTKTKKVKTRYATPAEMKKFSHLILDMRDRQNMFLPDGNAEACRLEMNAETNEPNLRGGKPVIYYPWLLADIFSIPAPKKKK